MKSDSSPSWSNLSGSSPRRESLKCKRLELWKEGEDLLQWVPWEQVQCESPSPCMGIPVYLGTETPILSAEGTAGLPEWREHRECYLGQSHVCCRSEGRLERLLSRVRTRRQQAGGETRWRFESPIATVSSDHELGDLCHTSQEVPADARC